MGCDLDTRDLPDEDADQLRALVELGAAALATRRQAKEARDAVQYEIIVEHGTKETTAHCDDLTVPEDLAPLLAFLIDRSGPVPPA